MSEEFNIPESQSVPAADFAEGDVLDEWIAGATVAKRSVPIYGKPGLIAEIEELEREAKKYDELEADEALGDGHEQEIEERFNALYAEYMASKSTWTVRALGDDDWDVLKVELEEAIGEQPETPVEPTEPTPLSEKRTPAQVGRYERAMEEYAPKKAAYDAEVKVFEKTYATWVNERNLRQVAAAVVRIDFADGRSVDSIELEQLRRMAKVLGDRQVLSLLAAIRAAMTEEPTITAPFSHRTSRSETT